MKYYDANVTFNEIPHEISLVFSITGCGGRCEGCHSVHLHDPNSGTELTKELYIDFLKKDQGLITNVLFLGGDWYPETLNEYIKIAKKMGYKTSLYTNLEYKEVPRKIKYNLNYLKTGKYMKEYGGLESIFTNQRLYELKPVKKDITDYFWAQSKPRK